MPLLQSAFAREHSCDTALSALFGLNMQLDLALSTEQVPNCDSA